MSANRLTDFETGFKCLTISPLRFTCPTFSNDRKETKTFSSAEANNTREISSQIFLICSQIVFLSGVHDH